MAYYAHLGYANYLPGIQTGVCRGVGEAGGKARSDMSGKFREDREGATMLWKGKRMNGGGEMSAQGFWTDSNRIWVSASPMNGEEREPWVGKEGSRGMKTCPSTAEVTKGEKIRPGL